MVWFGLVWFGLVWFGLVWFGLVWFGRSSKWFEWQEETQSWGHFTKALLPRCFEQSVATANDSLEHVMI